MNEVSVEMNEDSVFVIEPLSEDRGVIRQVRIESSSLRV